MVEKSKCLSPRTGKPLKTYMSESDAQRAVGHVRFEYGNEMVLYRCEDCGLWYLSPRNRSTPATLCPYCKASDGSRKDLYVTKKDAKQRAKIIREKRAAKLQVYKCPHQEGWHLTSKK